MKKLGIKECPTLGFSKIRPCSKDLGARKGNEEGVVITVGEECEQCDNEWVTIVGSEGSHSGCGPSERLYTAELCTSGQGTGLVFYQLLNV